MQDIIDRAAEGWFLNPRGYLRLQTALVDNKQYYRDATVECLKKAIKQALLEQRAEFVRELINLQPSIEPEMCAGMNKIDREWNRKLDSLISKYKEV